METSAPSHEPNNYRNFTIHNVVLKIIQDPPRRQEDDRNYMSEKHHIILQVKRTQTEKIQCQTFRQSDNKFLQPKEWPKKSHC